MNKSLAINNLKLELSKTLPLHDTPIGVVHPYWARKPLNIIELIISNLTSKNDIVLDPFMGSGTTILAAARLGRKAYGSDINPLAVFIVQEIFKLGSDPESSLRTLRNFVSEAEKIILPLFQFENEKYVERERYTVIGNFQNGEFDLILIETVTKEFRKEKWTKRKVEPLPYKLNLPEAKKKYLRKPFDFLTSDLLYNSRIAIPEGANLSQFFTESNRVAINILLEISRNKELDLSQQKLCRFLISACLPLLRLSDKKASSQWPYWRPKNNLTSRNPIVVLHDRLKQIEEAIQWMSLQPNNINTYKKIDSTVILKECAVQKLHTFFKKKADLILTDPPYNDHVPYLEYSAFWNNILGFHVDASKYSSEIVNSDAPSRRNDTKEYLLRLEEGLGACADVLSKDGILVWFYQDQVLQSWSCLFEAAKKNKLFILDVIPIKKQRRSMKTVTSPEKTLDGDLIILFSKQILNSKLIQNKESSANSYFDKYAQEIKKMLLDGSVVELAKKYKRINQIINL